MVRSTARGFRPSPTESAPCGSVSTRSTWRPCSARAAPRLMAVVVLPTPPFWLARAMTFPISGTSGPPTERLSSHRFVYSALWRDVVLGLDRRSDKSICHLVDGWGGRILPTRARRRKEQARKCGTGEDSGVRTRCVTDHPQRSTIAGTAGHAARSLRRSRRHRTVTCGQVLNYRVAIGPGPKRARSRRWPGSTALRPYRQPPHGPRRFATARRPRSAQVGGEALAGADRWDGEQVGDGG